MNRLGLLFLLSLVVATSNAATTSSSQYIKIDSTGAALPSSAKTWACTRDSKSGLTWTNEDKLSMWYEPDSTKNNGYAGQVSGTTYDGIQSFNGSNGYKNETNQKKLCGATDWRMPTIYELTTLYTCSRANSDISASGSFSSNQLDVCDTGPKINNTYFPYVSDNYIFSSSQTNDKQKVWYMDTKKDFISSEGYKNTSLKIFLVSKSINPTPVDTTTTTTTTPTVPTTAVAPVASIVSSDKTASLNTPFNLIAKATDTNADVKSITINWGDNSALQTFNASNNVNLPLSHIYTAVGKFTITIYATNGTKLSSKNVLKIITIVNRVPTLSLVSSDKAASTNTAYNLTFNANDADGDLIILVIDWGDKTTPETIKLNGSSLSLNHIYLLSGKFTWSIVATDSRQGSSKKVSKSITIAKSTSTTATSSSTSTTTTPTTGYSKISNTGVALSDSAVLGAGSNDWACTRDNKTGLLWEVKTDDGGLRDKDWYYSWYEPDASKNGGSAGYQNGNGHPEWCKGSNCDTLAYKNAVNNKTLCGSKDWRMPTQNELVKLFVCSDGKYNANGMCTNNKTVTYPTINTSYFPNTSEGYWSSSYFSDLAVLVSFRLGDYGGNTKNAWYGVRLVSDTRYTKISNAGVALLDTAVLGTGSNDWACTRDNKTGLIWEVKTDDGGLRDKDWNYSWYEPDASKNGGFAGYENNGPCKGSSCNTFAYKNTVNKQTMCGSSDWRLPTNEELRNLVFCSDGKYNQIDINSSGLICTTNGNGLKTTSPTIDLTYFPNTPQISFWSSLTTVDNSKNAWGVYFYTGHVGGGGKGGYGVSVRLVHGG